MIETELQRTHNYPIYPRDSKIFSDKGFVNIDNGFQGGSHWTAFSVEKNKSYHIDSSSGQLDKLYLIN